VAAVQQHFEAVGFSLPHRMDLPSWLMEITTPAGGRVHCHGSLLLWANLKLSAQQ
jgi:hypothetical protein